MFVSPRIFRQRPTGAAALPSSFAQRLAGYGLVAALAASVSLFLSGCGSITMTEAATSSTAGV
ncbi:MAG: hypothetical protein WB974_14480, partial [Acidobacteriaceae bacterium]